MLRRIFPGLATLAIVLAAGASGQAAEKKLILGIFYAGCATACEGFKAGVAESGIDADVVIRDIEQDKSRVAELVAQAREMDADLVLTHGTSVTLGMLGTLQDSGNDNFLNDIPAVFTLVADPFGTGIAQSFENSGRANVTGTFNRVPEAVNIEVIRQYDPGFSKLGLLYNSNERNSVIKFEELTGLAEELGIELVALEIDPGNTDAPDPAMIPIRMAEMREMGVRWLYLGSSSFLSRNGGIFTSSAVENGIAIVSPYESLVRDRQALLSIAALPYDVGRLAAEQALKILRDGATPGDLPILQATEFAYVVNMDVARKLGRFPPVTFLQVAQTVN